MQKIENSKKLVNHCELQTSKKWFNVLLMNTKIVFVYLKSKQKLMNLKKKMKMM